MRSPDVGGGISSSVDLVHGSDVPSHASWSEQSSLALADLFASMRAPAMWSALAWIDIKHRYRRSVLGPFWITITMAVLILGIGTLYGILFNLPLRDYLPYIALGDIVWIYMSTAAQEGCSAFTASENLIRSMRVPFMAHVMRVVLRCFLVFLHGAVAYLPFVLIFDLEISTVALYAIPGVVLVALMTPPLILLLSCLTARFRDIQPIVTNMMQMGFFLTPIIWKPEMLGEHRWVADFNPLFHFIEVVRAPMMGNLPEMQSYIACIVSVLVLWIVAFPVFIAVRRKLSVWV